MEKIIAFLRLARWPNLVFFALTQWMFIFCIVTPIFNSSHVEPNIHGNLVWLLILSYVLVAAGGYIINDYFDLNIDQINKPNKVMIDTFIGRRWAIFFHSIFNLASISIGIYIDFKTHIRFLGIANFIYGFLLFVYSLSLKKKLLIGNILIAILLAWVIVVISLCEINQFYFSATLRQINTQKLLRYTILYAGFAFIVNLIREVVKDMEDVEGDRQYGCNTMPIAWGINATKVFVAVWLTVLIAILSLLQLYVFQLKWYYFSLYSIILIIIPLILMFKKLFSANKPEDYHRISTIIKVVMFTGILSMFFFRLYT